MSKRINSTQHARTNSAKEKAGNPVAEALAVIPGVTDANAFVQAAKKVPVGKKIKKADAVAQADEAADKKVADEAQDRDVANNTAPVEATVTGGARMVMAAVDAAEDQAGSGGSGSTAVDDDDDGGLGAAPLIIGGAIVVGGVLALVGTGGNGTVTPNTAPTFTSGTTANVNENVATTAVVYDANATDAQSDTITYSISGTDAALFTIDADDGEVRFKASPDFEGTPTKTSYSVDVTATDSKGAATKQTVTLTLANVNEAPVISSNGGGATAAVSVAENSTAVTTVTSTDVDAGATKTFSLNGGADASKFTINATTGALAFIAAPDFETPTDVGANNVYDVVVRVSDGTLTDDQAIAVTVTNVNEAPVITNSNSAATASLNVFENTTVVTTVAATDPENQTRTFSIQGGADAALFNINATTGELTFKTAPNFEVPADSDKNNSYLVNVRATDNATPGLFDEQLITVNVINQNEAPTITSGPTASVNENVAISTVVYDANATDVDANTTLTYSIGGTDAAAFTIDADDGEVRFKNSPDFETKSSYSITVTATDNANPALPSAAQPVTITVINLNEAPVFTSGPTATVAENAATATVVYDANATDPEGNTITYTIGGTDAAAFTIDADDGEVRLKTSADFETKSSYAITVTATDNANPAQPSTQNVAVTVTNVNEAPTITSGATGAVNENAATSVVIYDANATDPENNTVTYSVTGTDAALVTIDADDGEVRLNASANFEAKSSYTFNVVATDNGNPAQSGSKTVTVAVNDLVDLATLPTAGTFNAGVQGAGQTDTNFLLTENGDENSSIIITGFTANDVIQLTGGDIAFLGFSRDFNDVNDLRIDYSDAGQGGTNAISTIIIDNVLDNVTFVNDEASAAIAMGQAGRDFFLIA